MLTTDTLHIDPATLRPPHAVRDAAHYDALAASMRAGGWQGRPVLAFCAEARAADLAARGVRECEPCRGYGCDDRADADCDACGRTGEVAL